jgi:hypothetical protein
MLKFDDSDDDGEYKPGQTTEKTAAASSEAPSSEVPKEEEEYVPPVDGGAMAEVDLGGLGGEE